MEYYNPNSSKKYLVIKNILIQCSISISNIYSKIHEVTAKNQDQVSQLYQVYRLHLVDIKHFYNHQLEVRLGPNSIWPMLCIYRYIKPKHFITYSYKYNTKLFPSGSLLTQPEDLKKTSRRKNLTTHTHYCTHFTILHILKTICILMCIPA